MNQYRWYQQRMHDEAFKHWGDGVKNVALVAPTGAGKTRMISGITQAADVRTCAMAHRKELITQLSLALASLDMPHRIIASSSTIKDCTKLHLKYLGQTYYDPQNKLAVASVDTILSQIKKSKQVREFLKRVELKIVDECHHVLKENKWGRAIATMSGGYGLFMTATLERADGNGLGRHTDGLIDKYVELVSMGELISENYLTPFEIYCPPSDIVTSDINLTASGDFSKKKLSKRHKESKTIVGDVVRHYLDRFEGKRGITFCVDLEEAHKIEKAYKDNGVPAIIMEGSMPDLARYEAMDKYRAGEYLQIVNVDLIGEGVDVPAVECISMVRHTASFPLYVQQFGRPLRKADDKFIAGILDHVGNVARLGLGHLKTGRATLERTRERRGGGSDEDALTQCVNPACFRSYPSKLKACPSCGSAEIKEHRAEVTRPVQVDGMLQKYTCKELEAMQKQIAESMQDWGDPSLRRGLDKIKTENHRVKRDELLKLRDEMARWLGEVQWSAGLNRDQSVKLFAKTFGVDPIAAQTKTGPQMAKLREKIRNER